MDPIRKLGLVMAAVATVLWAFVVIGYLTTSPGEGVNIGAAFAAVLATPVSLAASIALLLSLRTARLDEPPGAGPSRAPVRWLGAALAVASLILLPAVWVLGPMDRLSSDALTTLLFSGIAAFVVSSALIVLPRGRRG